MTKQMMTKQIFELCGGTLNGSVLTQAEFKKELNPEGTSWFSITLPDGMWLMQITHSKKWGWEYYIPDNEDQQAALEELYREGYESSIYGI